MQAVENRDTAAGRIAELTQSIKTTQSQASEVMDAAEKRISEFSQSLATASRLRSGFSYEPLYTGEEDHFPVRYAGGYTYGFCGSTTLMPHGRGVLRLPNDVTFSGKCFYKGELQGYGVCKLPNGAVYTGEFAAKKCTGDGTLVLPDGMALEGSWVSNKLHGYGKITQIVGWPSSGTPIPIVNTTTVWAWHGKLYKTRKEWELLTQLGWLRQIEDNASSKF